MTKGGKDSRGMSPIAKEIRAYLDDSGETLNALARRSGVETSTLYRIASPTFRPKYPTSPHIVDAIAGALPAEYAGRFRQAIEGSGARRPRFRRPPSGTPFQMMVCDRLIELDLSYEEVTRRTDGAISKALLSHIVQGKSKRPADQTIKALVLGLDLDENALREAVAATNAGMTYQLPPQAQTLSAEGWKQVQGFIDYMLKQERERDQ